MKFYGKKQDGKTLVYSRDAMQAYMDSLEGDFEIKITPVKDIRTFKMNNQYWLWLTYLSDYSGYTKDELHSYFKQKLLCEEDSVQGEKIMNCQSTSDLTIKEFGHYLDEVARLSIQNFNYSLPSLSEL